jgi:hypothetical protein
MTISHESSSLRLHFSEEIVVLAMLSIVQFWSLVGVQRWKSGLDLELKLGRCVHGTV